MAKEGSIFKFVVGLFSGLLSGIVVGLLLAPKTGREMREDLKEKTSELKVLAKGKFAEFKEFGTEQAVKVANVIQEKASKIGTKLDEITSRGSEILIQDEVQ